MPAPVPIVFQYDDAGTLGSAASLAGFQSGQLARQEQDQRNQLQRDQIGQQAAAQAQDALNRRYQLELQARQLQIAHDDLMKRQSGTPTAPTGSGYTSMNPATNRGTTEYTPNGGGYYRATPAADTNAVSTKRSLYQTRLQGMQLSPDEQQGFENLVSDVNRTPEQFQRDVDDFVRMKLTQQAQQGQQQRFDQGQQFKQDRAAKADERGASRDKLAEDTFKQRQDIADRRFAQSAQGDEDRKAREAARNTNDFVKKQITEVSKQLKNIEKTSGFNPDAGEEQFQGTPSNMFGMGGSKPDEAGLQKYRQYKQLEATYKQLLDGGPTQPDYTAAPAAAPTSQPSAAPSNSDPLGIR